MPNEFHFFNEKSKKQDWVDFFNIFNLRIFYDVDGGCTKTAITPLWFDFLKLFLHFYNQKTYQIPENKLVFL